MWNLWGIPFIKLGNFSLLGSHTPWQSLASKRCHKRLICCISVGVLMMLNQVSIVVVRQDGLMQLLHKLLFDPVQLFFMRLLFWCLARLVTSQLVHHAHYFWPQAAISEVSVEIGLWTSVNIVNLTPCIKVIFPTSVKPDFIFPLSKQLLTLKWARQVSSCSHTVSMASSDFHWGNPPRPCAKMFWLMSWNSGWAFLGHRFNKVHNVIWGQSFTSSLKSCQTHKKRKILRVWLYDGMCNAQQPQHFKLWPSNAKQVTESDHCLRPVGHQGQTSTCGESWWHLNAMGPLIQKKGISFVNLQSFMSALHSILQLYYPCIYSYVMKV